MLEDALYDQDFNDFIVKMRSHTACAAIAESDGVCRRVWHVTLKGTACGLAGRGEFKFTGLRDILDMLITYFSIVLICSFAIFSPRVTDWLAVG